MSAPSLTSLGLAMATTLLLSTAGCDARPVGAANGTAASLESGHTASGFAAALSTAAQLATQTATQAVMSAMGRTAISAPEPKQPPVEESSNSAPPRVAFNTSIVHRHARELGDMSGWSDGRCTWYGGPGGPGA